MSCLGSLQNSRRTDSLTPSLQPTTSSSSPAPRQTFPSAASFPLSPHWARSHRSLSSLPLSLNVHSLYLRPPSRPQLLLPGARALQGTSQSKINVAELQSPLSLTYLTASSRATSSTWYELHLAHTGTANLSNSSSPRQTSTPAPPFLLPHPPIHPCRFGNRSLQSFPGTGNLVSRTWRPDGARRLQLTLTTQPGSSGQEMTGQWAFGKLGGVINSWKLAAANLDSPSSFPIQG